MKDTRKITVINGLRYLTVGSNRKRRAGFEISSPIRPGVSNRKALQSGKTLRGFDSVTYK